MKKSPLQKVSPDNTLQHTLNAAGYTCRLMWEIRGHDNTAVAWISCYLVGTHPIIVQTYDDGNGWQAYLPVKSLQVDLTVRAVIGHCANKIDAELPAGSWRAEKPDSDSPFFEDVNIVREDGLAVGVAVQNGGITAEDAIRHATLMAAAPRLLAALRTIVTPGTACDGFEAAQALIAELSAELSKV